MHSLPPDALAAAPDGIPSTQPIINRRALIGCRTDTTGYSAAAIGGGSNTGASKGLTPPPVPVTKDQWSEMPAAAKRYKIKFEETRLQFSERYPEALSDVLPLAEFDGIIRKINGDMTQEIRTQQKKVHKWSAICIGLCILVAGVCLTPVVFVQTRRQRKKTKAFWERLRTYLGEINRKTYLKRNLEWKLVEDKAKIRKRDVVNPLLAYRLEVVHRTQKSKAPSESGRIGGQSVTMASTTASRAASVAGGSPILSQSVAAGSVTSRSAPPSVTRGTTRSASKPTGIISLASFNTEPVAGARSQRAAPDQARDAVKPIKEVREEREEGDGEI